ncbi:MAG: hypothetical protein N2114_07155 [Candidatus Goldbacteria bacterium]|nr:hypothetical protein [Candidatus Goldiibacteriota bacterium]
MKRFITNILFWIFLFIIIFISLFNYSIFRIFFYIDIIWITSIILFFSGMIWAGFTFAIIYSLIIDSIYMDFLGINLTVYLLSLLFLFYLCENINTENLLNKIFIILISYLFKIFIYTIFIFFFHWDGKLYFIPIRMIFNIFFTVIFSAAILWINDLLKWGMIRWQKTK